MANSTITKLERGLLELFFKTVGAGSGFYDFTARAFREGIAGEGLYQENLQQLRAALKASPAADLENFLRERYRAGESARLLSDILPKEAAVGRATWESDLLEGLARPLHPALFSRTMPSFAVGESSMLAIGRGVNLPKAAFTLRQLLGHYFTCMHVAPLMARQQTGPWNWLLQQADLNELLYAIDLAGEVSMRESREIPPLGLADYLPEARRILAHMHARQGEANPG